MRVAEIAVGQVVAVSDGVTGKHLNVVDDPQRNLQLVENGSLGGLTGIMLLSQTRADWLAEMMGRAPQAGPHRATVLQTGLPWGGRKSGVLVQFELNERMGRIVRLFDLAVLTAVVPASMVWGDYWDVVAEREADRLQMRADAKASAYGPEGDAAVARLQQYQEAMTGRRPVRPMAWMRRLRDDPAVAKSRLLILWVIGFSAADHGVGTFAEADLAAKTGRSVATVRETVEWALATGWLTRLPTGEIALTDGRAS